MDFERKITKGTQPAKDTPPNYLFRLECLQSIIQLQRHKLTPRHALRAHKRPPIERPDALNGLLELVEGDDHAVFRRAVREALAVAEDPLDLAEPLNAFVEVIHEMELVLVRVGQVAKATPRRDCDGHNA